MAEKLAAKQKIPVFHLVIIILAAYVTFLWGYITRIPSGPKYWTVTGTFLPWFYIMLVVALVGKRGIKLDKTLLIAILYLFVLTCGKWYLFSGTSEVDFYNNISGTLSSALSMGAWPSEASQYLGNLIPSWLVVHDSAAAGRYFYGGGEPIWGPMVAPILTWSLIFVSLALMGLCTTFFLIGPEWYETEHLPFPLTIPTRYVINKTYTEDPVKFGDIFYNIKGNRIFWVGIIIGMIANIPYIVSQILPAIPVGAFIGGGYGVFPITSIIPNIVEMVQSVLPNATWIVVTIAIFNILIYMLVPFEVCTSTLFWIIVMGWLYPGIATRAGLLAPGADVGSTGPIPLGYFNPASTNLGLAFIVIWLMRGRLKQAFSSFSKDFEVGGFSMRLGMTLLLIGILMFWGIWIMAGLDPLSTILLWLMFFLTSIGGAYYYAQLFWYGAHCTGYEGFKLVWPISAGLGLLPTTPTATSVNAAAFGYMTTTMGTCVGAFESNSMINLSQLSVTYAIGADTKADLRRLFIYILVAIVFLVPFAFIFDAWFNSHVGITNTSQSSMDMAWWNPASAALDLGVRSITWSVGVQPIPERAAGMFAIAIFVFIAHIISSKILLLGYIFNPIGLATAGIETYWSGWLNPLFALIFKYILNRVAGPRRAYEVTIALVSGIAVGVGLLYPLLGLYVLFTSSLPNLAMLWK
jgi:hypothetical protein